MPLRGLEPLTLSFDTHALRLVAAANRHGQRDLHLSYRGTIFSNITVTGAYHTRNADLIF